MNIKLYLLCYAFDGCMYFTNDYKIEKNVKIITQTGDDWDDYPYELNAGEPYDDEDKENIQKIVYRKSEWFDNYTVSNKESCVNDINESNGAWLTYNNSFKDNTVTLRAGDTIGEVIDKMTGVDAYFGMIK